MSYWLLIWTFLSGIVVLYLQVLLMPDLTVGGVVPNIFLGWIVFQVWRKPVTLLIPIVFILGLGFDLTMPGTFGLQTMLFILLSIGIDEFHRPMEKDSYVTMLISLGLVCLAYSLMMFLVYTILSGAGFKLLLVMLWMTFYNLFINVVLTAILVFISHLKLDFRHG